MGRASTFGGFDELTTYLRAEEILGVEIYTRALGLPADLIDPRSECGAIAVWTQPPPAAKKPEHGHAQ
jgi:hypothetical protein